MQIDIERDRQIERERDMIENAQTYWRKKNAPSFDQQEEEESMR